MRYFTFVQPKGETSEPEYVTMSEEDIRKEYYPYWYKKMCEKYEQSYVDEHHCFEDCLEDWVIIHWAQEEKNHD
jgi:hypothetical protein